MLATPVMTPATKRPARQVLTPHPGSGGDGDGGGGPTWQPVTVIRLASVARRPDQPRRRAGARSHSDRATSHAAMGVTIGRVGMPIGGAVTSIDRAMPSGRRPSRLVATAMARRHLATRIAGRSASASNRRVATTSGARGAGAETAANANASKSAETVVDKSFVMITGSPCESLADRWPKSERQRPGLYSSK